MTHKVDEILFQAAIHPAQRSNTLTPEQLEEVHKQIRAVINTAVEVNADHKKFPAHWLFKYRWGKGRRNEPATFTLPDGTLATVIHQTVGGRTSAIVESVQKLLGEVASDVEDGPASMEEEGDVAKQEEDIKPVVKRYRKVASKPVEGMVEENEKRTAKRRGRRTAKTEEEEDELIKPQEALKAEDVTKAVKITTRKRKSSMEPVDGLLQRQKVEVKIEPVSARATRASARQNRS